MVVEPGASAGFLAPWPVNVLGHEELTDLLVRLGVYTLGDFAALPANEVADRFGPEGRHCHLLAGGGDTKNLKPRRVPPDLRASSELDPPVVRVDAVGFTARSLARELCEELSRRGLACSRVLIQTETEHGEVLSRLWSSDSAFGPATLAERVRWQLDWWLSAPDRPSAGLSRLSLVPDEVVPDGQLQMGFWGESGEAGEKVARALARVQGMLGPQAVTRAVLQGARSPGEAVRTLPWGLAVPGPAPSEKAPWPGRLPPPSPAAVYPRPPRAELRGADGTEVAVTGRGVLTDVPVALSVDGGPPLTVSAWAGPWPADERWWTPDPRRRARLQLVVEGAPACLLSLEKGRWSVEATYD
jgi:protein ImuB